MRERTAQLAACAVLIIFPLRAPLLQAQQAEATLSGKVADSSGAAVANARVTVRNLETGQTAQVQSDGTGAYHLPKLAAGDYQVTVSVKGFTVKSDKVTLTAGATLTYDATLNGERVHGIGQADGPVAIVTAGAFGAALLSVSLHANRSPLIPTTALAARKMRPTSGASAGSATAGRARIAAAPEP